MSFFEDIKAAKMIGGSGGTPAPTLIEKNITANGEYSASDDSADGYSAVSVAVPNTYSASDEGKVVSSGALVSQTSTTATTNGTIDTTTNNSVTVNVANSYTAQDEGKVVSNGALVAQTSATFTENGTYDTTGISSITIAVPVLHTYGVVWDKTDQNHSSQLTYTDDAAGFSRPDPFVNDGNHPGSSPFDTLMPWAGMHKVTIDGNVMVGIPKFWFKWTSDASSLKLQISDTEQEGFLVSPAHQARNANEQDRDFVYIGRYKCVKDTSDTTNNYKSQTEKSPMTNITRATARTAIAGLGTGYSQQDFAMFWTVRMLYLVEFADWNSQATIGNGCGNGSSVVQTGSTDSMTYHTGTIQTDRTTYNGGTQYRWIEGIWDNVTEWCDGIFFAGTNKLDVYIVKNPANFTDYDTTNAVNVGQRANTSNCVSDFFVPSTSGYEWALYPNEVYGTDYTKYVADHCRYNSSGVVLRFGGYYNQSQSYGMFSLSGNSDASYQDSSLGSRLQYLPPQN